MIANGKKLITPRSQLRLGKKDTLEVLNAVRVMSIGWVVLGHTFLNYTNLPVLSNITNISDIFTEFKYVLVYEAEFAVDTFFWVSGFLMAYLFILELEKTKNFTFFKFLLVYVHRFLRITPLYMFVLFFYWSMQVYLGNGPLWFLVGEAFNADCHDYWYSNLLYLNNFIPDYRSSGCLGVSWYLANDMQFFIVTVIIIVLYVKVSKFIGWFYVVFCFGLSVICRGLIAHHFDLNPVAFDPNNNIGNNNFNYLYVKPYTRIAPYSFGVGCAFVVISYRKFQDKKENYDKIGLFIAKHFENIIIRVASFALGLALINVLIFSVYDTYKHRTDDGYYDHWSKNQNAAYLAFDRPIYGLAFSFLFLPLLLGHFRAIIDFLSWGPWSFFAQLSFAIYLLHYNIIETCLRSFENAVVFNEYNCIRDSFFFFFLTAVIAIPVVLLVEMPAGNIEKLIFRAPVKKEKNVLLESHDKISLMDLRKD